MDNITNDFLKAVKDGNVEYFKKILGTNKARNLLLQTSPQNNTPLHIAARFGHISIIQEILGQQKGTLFAKNRNGDTPMHVAAKAGHRQVIESFFHCIKEGMNMANDVESGQLKKRRLLEVLKAKDNKGNTPLHGAVTFRHKDVVQMLLAECPELSILTNEAGQSAFSIAVEVKSPEILQTMVDLKVPAHFTMGYSYDQTILHGTVLRNDLDSMNIILEVFPELVHRKDKMLRGPLHYAAAAGYTAMVNQLLTHNVSIAYQGDIYGQSPLHMTAWCDHLAVLEVLIEKCPSTIELLDQRGRNALHLAAANGKLSIVEYLLKQPEIEDLVNAKNILGLTPLHLAANHLQCEVVQALSEDPRVDIRAIDIERRSAIKMAQRRFIESEIVSLNDEENSRTIGSSLIQSQNNVVAPPVVRTEPRKRLTLKILQAAKDGKVRDLEGIMAMHVSYEVVRSRRSEEMAKTLILLATVVATFTFAAGMTVPGGFNNSGDKHNGQASLSSHILFQLFIIFDALAMSLSMSVAVMVFWSLWWTKDNWFHYTMLVAVQMTWLALLAMAAAFITGLLAVLEDVLWIRMLAGVIVSIFTSCLLLFFPFRFIFIFRWFLSVLSPQMLFGLRREIFKVIMKRITMDY
ncbi:hypothetical protein ACFE04_005762 [Oxalis oulophora]